MLRSKAGKINFLVVDKQKIEDTIVVDPREYVSEKQLRAMASKPDMIWQFAQRLEEEYAQKGQNIKVFAQSRVSVNGKAYHLFIDPNVDLAAEEWRHFSHSPWILPSPAD